MIRTGGEQRLSQLPDLAVGLRRALPSRPLWPDFGPDAFDAALLEFACRTRASAAEAGVRPMRRARDQRRRPGPGAPRRPVPRRLVPGGRGRRHRGRSRPVERSSCSRPPAIRRSPPSASSLAARRRPRAAVTAVLGGAGAPGAVGSSSSAVAALTRDDPRDGLAAGWRRCSARCTSPCWASSSGSGTSAPSIPADAPFGGARCRAGLDPAAGPRRLGLRHRRLPRRPRVRPRPIHDPHLAVQDRRGPGRRCRRRDHRDRARARGRSARTRSAALLLGP